MCCRSVGLLLQISLPCALFTEGPSELCLKGGTNAEMAPQIDYTLKVSAFRDSLSSHRLLQHLLCPSLFTTSLQSPTSAYTLLNLLVFRAFFILSSLFAASFFPLFLSSTSFFVFVFCPHLLLLCHVRLLLCLLRLLHIIFEYLLEMHDHSCLLHLVILLIFYLCLGNVVMK